jgi:non-ribosomal peptide synthetase component E (peptide arylation enzyme)
VVDAEGNVAITGRSKDIIIRNAENISALEVEEALFRHPDIVEAAVVSAPDARTGERVCAFVVAAPGTAVTLTSIAQHCRALGLAIQKVPEQLELVDSLPRNPFGKVLKQDLKQRVAARVVDVGQP